ncbi:hypothetical protein ACFWFZ_28785, partial [Streptomyces sp. NPDC060232]|uniref:hypothetical protein n=1 Tax=Streptomyces sp. NPDC060232 TaxID=3347079 RepID=UPI003646089F
MADFTPEQMRRMHDFADQLAELAEHHEDQWKVQTTDGQISLTMIQRGLTASATARRFRTPSGTPSTPAAGRSKRAVSRATPPTGDARHRVTRPARERRKAPHRTLNGLVRGFPTMIVR